MLHPPQHPLMFWTTTLGAHLSLAQGGQGGGEQSDLERAGWWLHRAGRVCSSSAAPLEISQYMGLDGSQETRLFPSLPAFLSSTRSMDLAVLGIREGQEDSQILRGQLVPAALPEV